MLKCVENCGSRHPPKRVPDVKKLSSLLYTHKFPFETKQKKCTIEPKSYTAALLYLFFDSLLSTCPRKMETEKWPKAADSPLFE